jgi:hypothetical protein
MSSGLGQAQPPLAPQNPGKFLDQMLRGRSLWAVLGHQRRDQGAILVGVAAVCAGGLD